VPDGGYGGLKHVVQCCTALCWMVVMVDRNMWYSAVWRCARWWLWWTETCGTVLYGVVPDGYGGLKRGTVLYGVVPDGGYGGPKRGTVLYGVVSDGGYGGPKHGTVLYGIVPDGVYGGLKHVVRCCMVLCPMVVMVD